MDRFKWWLRWLAVLPGGLIGGAFMTFPLHWTLSGLLSSIEPYPKLPEQILTPFVVAIGFITFGARIAPAYKTEVAWVLFGLWMVSLGGMAAFIVFVGHIGNRQYFFHGGGLASAGAFIGGVIGFLVARKEAEALASADTPAPMVDTEAEVESQPDDPAPMSRRPRKRRRRR